MRFIRLLLNLLPWRKIKHNTGSERHLTTPSASNESLRRGVRPSWLPRLFSPPLQSLPDAALTARQSSPSKDGGGCPHSPPVPWRVQILNDEDCPKNHGSEPQRTQEDNAPLWVHKRFFSLVKRQEVVHLFQFYSVEVLTWIN